MCVAVKTLSKVTKIAALELKMNERPVLLGLVGNGGTVYADVCAQGSCGTMAILSACVLPAEKGDTAHLLSRQRSLYRVTMKRAHF